MWTAVSAAYKGRAGVVTISKVKARVSGRLHVQHPWFTKNNAAADELAKEAARSLLQTKRDALVGEVSAGLDLQTHLVASLVKRLNCLQIPFDAGKPATDTQCRCVPTVRIRSKSNCCQGHCLVCKGSTLQVSDQVFLECVRLSRPVRQNLWQCLRQRYPAYWAVFARAHSWGLGPAVAVQSTDWSRHPNSRFLQNLLEFWSQDRWHYPNDASVSDARVTWQELVFDFIGEFGVVKGLLEPHTRLSLLTRRFRDHSVKLLVAAGAPAKGFTNISHLKCFTGGSAAGICARRNFSCPHIVWGFLLSRCSSHASRNALARSRPNAHFTPSWEFLPK